MPKIASLWLASVVLFQPEETLTYEKVALDAPPGAAELAARAEIAELRRALATSSRGLLDEPVLEVTAGPRLDHDEDETRGDVELELEVPWRKRSQSRQRLEALVGEAASTLPAAARSAADLELRHAYVEAWRARELLALRESSSETAQRLAEVARAREQAGADPPFEAQLARLEAEEASAAAAAASADLAAAWSRLEGLSQPGLQRRLEPPAFEDELASTSAGCGPPEARTTSLPSDLPSGSVAWRAAELRAELAAARSELELDAELSRLSWLGSLAREGREDVARVGVAWALRRPGVATSRREAADTAVAGARRESELARSELAARFASAHARLRTVQPSMGAASESFAVPLAAIEARFTAGRASPAETLSLRRQILTLQEQALERAALREHAAAELIALCTPVEEATP